MTTLQHRENTWDSVEAQSMMLDVKLALAPSNLLVGRRGLDPGNLELKGSPHQSLCVDLGTYVVKF
jgi:hypothetical protein